jgi:hypothetical protein
MMDEAMAANGRVVTMPPIVKSVKLLKVRVQVVLAVEDDEGLSELACDPLEIPGRQWDSYRTPGGTFDQSVEDLRRKVMGT